MELLCLELGWSPHEVHLIGVSMGGMVALELAAGLREGAFGALSADAHFLSLGLIVTQGMGWRVPWRGMPPLEYSRLLLQAALPSAITGLSAKGKMYKGMESAFSREWMREPSGQMHPKTGAELTNGQVIVRRGTKEWYAKIAEGVPPMNSFAGRAGQASAIATHCVDSERLAGVSAHMARHQRPMLVICAGRDNLVRYEAQQRLAAELAEAVTEVVDLKESSHGVNNQDEEVVNAAILRLLQSADHGFGQDAQQRSKL